jgi:HEAT repeat protein
MLGLMLPREAIEAECGRRGKDELVAGCVALLRAQPVDEALVSALGVAAAPSVLDGGPESQYWLRVWGARGLLWAWDEAAVPALLEALDDEHWRVREMAAKVVARHLVGAAFETVEARCADPVPRVAAAAQRAIRALVSAGE